MIELLRGQALSPAFTNTDIIAGFIYEHTRAESVVAWKLDEKATLLIFLEREDIKKNM